jgi:hypothetical protein
MLAQIQFRAPTSTDIVWEYCRLLNSFSTNTCRRYTKIKIKGKEARGFKMSSNMSSEVLDFFKWLYKFQIQSTKWQYVQRENKPKKNSNFAEKEP